MKDTNKIKTAIKILRDIDAESKNNYFTINKTKYFVNKNLLFKNGVQVGSIKNGVIIFNKPLVKTKKATTKGTRKMRSTFKPVVDESILNTNSKMRRNTMRMKPVVNGSMPTYNPLIKNFSEPEPEPVSEVSEVSEVPTEEPVSEEVPTEPVPVSEQVPPVPTEEPYDEHKEDL
jgi:hypothetical protein